MSDEIKLNRLEEILKGLGRVAVSYSGGVDSTFLLFVALRVLGRENVRSIMIRSEITPPWDIGFATSFVKKIDVSHEFVDAIEKLDNPDFVENTPLRCYHCKIINTDYIKKIIPDDFVIISGTNLTDEVDIRPGLKAEEECGVRQPLKEAGISKDEIRLYSRDMGVSGWDRPSSACLASRIPHGTPIEKEDLSRISDAEVFLREMGLDFVRVRAYPQKMAKIELNPEQMQIVMNGREKIVAEFKRLGFHNITLDLEGYVPAGIKFQEMNDDRTRST